VIATARTFSVVVSCCCPSVMIAAAVLVTIVHNFRLVLVQWWHS
jgi:hypothetical protein